MNTTLSRQEGTALVTALLITTLLFGIAGAYLILSYGGYDNSERELATVEARLACEDGITLSMAELKTGVDTDGNGVGNIEAPAADGTITVAATLLGGQVWRLHSVAVLRRARAGADVVAERIPAQTLNYAARAAITSEGPVATLGNISVDGRDWNINGTAIVGPGAYGISSMSGITNSGFSTVGGNGWAPAKPPHAGTQEPLATWADGINQDNSGGVDEELFDGKDDDGDGSIDEDTHGYPSVPDVMLHLPEGTLRDAAIASGTYFTSVAQFDAAIAANGNVVPGGKVIYCDFDLWEPVTFGNAFNDPPSVVVHHNSTGTAQMKNVHGCFRGLIMADFIVHLNGDFIVLGAIQSFCDSSIGNAFGNGNAQIKLCTAALVNLPKVGGTWNVRLRAWNRSVAQ